MLYYGNHANLICVVRFRSYKQNRNNVPKLPRDYISLPHPLILFILHSPFPSPSIEKTTSLLFSNLRRDESHFWRWVWLVEKWMRKKLNRLKFNLVIDRKSMSEEEFFEAADRENAIKMIFTVTDRRDHIQLDIQYSAINFLSPIVYELF